MAEKQSGTTAEEMLPGRIIAPNVGERAPEFLIETPGERLTVAELAARAGTMVLVSLDSYQFHPL